MNLAGIRAIGIDELHWQHGATFLTLVYQIDPTRKRLLWIGQHRRAKTLLQFFRWFGKDRLSVPPMIAVMEWFARSLKRKLEDKDLDKIEKTLLALIALKEKVTDVRDFSPVAKMPFKIHDLLQIGLRRNIELTEASIRELNRQNVTTSMVLVRAVFETASLLFDSANRVVHVTKKDDVKALDELDQFLMDVLVGFKSKDWASSEEFVARNVLTIIQRIGKQLDIDMMWYYEGLSEHAHPNYLGMMATYRLTPEEGNPIVKYADGPNESRDASIKIAIGGLAMGVEMTHMALKRHEAIADQFATLAERGIHEGGTWPADVDYPIKRG